MMNILKAKQSEGYSPYTCLAALGQGDTTTRLSAVVMGLGSICHGQVVKGILYLAAELGYLAFMVRYGLHNLAMLITLGEVEQQEVWDEAQQVYLYVQGDQSVLLLLYGVATLLLTLVMFLVWRGSLKSAYKAQCLQRSGAHVNTFREDLATLLDENLYRLLMTPPMFFITALTILPLIFMICMAFTNYSKIDNHLVLFDWVGLENFATLFDSNSILAAPSGRCWPGPWCGRCSPPSPTTFSVCCWLCSSTGKIPASRASGGSASYFPARCLCLCPC